MEIEKLQGNSHKTRLNSEPAEEKKIEKVVSSPVKTKKKSEAHKIADVFIAEDAKNVKSYVLNDVLIPAIKKAVSDIVTNGIDMILYGESGGTKRSKSSSNYVSYRDYSRNDRDRDRREMSRSSSRLNFDDLVYESRGEAEAVRDQMYEVLDRWGVVTVADLYDMSDITAPYTANKYGWTTLRNADVVRVRDGYVIKLPRACAID